MSAIQLEQVTQFNHSRDHIVGAGGDMKTVLEIKEGRYKGLKVIEGPFPPGSVPLAGGPQSLEAKVKIQYMDGQQPPKPAETLAAARALEAQKTLQPSRRVIARSLIKGVLTEYYAD